MHDVKSARPLPALDPETRFRLLVQGVTDYALFLLDPNGVIVSWNAGAQRIKGYAEDEIVGSHFSIFYTPEDRERSVPVRVLAEASRKGRFEAEGWRVRKGGSAFWAHVVIDAIRDDAGDLIGFAKITRDLTEQRKATEELRQSERTFQRLIDGVSDYAVFLLDRYGVVSSWNTGAHRIKGYQAGEIIGRHFSLFYTPEDRQQGKPAQALAEAEANGRFEAEALRMRKDGSTFWANVVIDAIFEDGRLVGFAKITRDITERKKAEEELRASHVEVAQLTRALADKDVLLREVNHRVKNNLQIICSLLDMQAVKVRDPAGREAIKETADRVRAMGLIHHALYDQENASAIGMQNYLRSLSAQIGRTLGTEQRGVTIEVEAADATFELSTAVPLALIANEVITNAIKHAFPDGSPGRVKVELQRAESDRWELAVADSGGGGQTIPPLDKARSTGFQIVRALVRQLGGEAGFEQGGDGTTFRLTFQPLQH